MTFLTTAQVGVATVDNGGFYSVMENTVTGRVVASSAVPYKEEAVRRILKAKNGPATLAPDDPDEFMDWLER